MNIFSEPDQFYGFGCSGSHLSLVRLPDDGDPLQVSGGFTLGLLLFGFGLEW